MARLGKFEYPEISLDEMLKSARAISRALGKSTSDIRTLSQWADDNAAREIQDNLQALSVLGLVEVRGNELRATKLAHRLADPPSPETYIMALYLTHRRVPLFKLLLESALNKQVATTKTQLFRLLVRARAADPADVEGQLDALWERYRAAVNEVRRALTSVPGRTRTLNPELDKLAAASAKAASPVRGANPT